MLIPLYPPDSKQFIEQNHDIYFMRSLNIFYDLQVHIFIKFRRNGLYGF